MKEHPGLAELSRFLEKVNLFARAGHDVLEHLAGRIHVTAFPKDEPVITKGDLGEAMYLILSGHLKVHDGDHAVATLGPGQFFGELSLLDKEPRSMSVSTLEDSVLGRIDRNDFYDVLRAFPDMTGDIIAVLNQRLRNQNEVLISEYRSREETLTELVRIRTAEVMQQSLVIAAKNKEMTESLQYASRLQSAILPRKGAIHSAFPDSFVLYLPKDIVSGDFYLFEKSSKGTVVAAADCTGHGVSGAIMSMLGHSLLRQIIVEKKISDPGTILSELNEGIIESLKQAETHTHDGMDVALCVFDADAARLHFAGANRPLWRIRNGQLEVIASDKLPIGGLQMERRRMFNSHILDLEAGDAYYLFSDGYADQFGGKDGRKLMTKKLKELLLSVWDRPMEKQGTFLEEFIGEWRGEMEQVDDILVMGIRI